MGLVTAGGHVDVATGPARRERITAAPAQGAGLGLTIAAAIAESHHTPLDTRANPDGGRTIDLTLPARPRSPLRADHSSGRAELQGPTRLAC